MPNEKLDMLPCTLTGFTGANFHPYVTITKSHAELCDFY